MKLFLLVSLFVIAAQTVATAPQLRDIIVGPGSPPASRIQAGQPAVRGQFPYMAFIIADDTKFCGGSLISRTWVLTAAHCTTELKPRYATGIPLNFRTFAVTLGAQERSASEDGAVTLLCTQSVTHERYYPLLLNDLGLIKLPGEVQLSEWISVVNLPSRSDVGNSYENAGVTVSGWGYTGGDDWVESPPSDSLFYVEDEVISSQLCIAYYDEAITNEMLCSRGSDLKSACQGDDGAPLVLTGSDPVKQIGLVNLSPTLYCEGHIAYPVVYVRLTSFLDWIEANSDVIINP